MKLYSHPFSPYGRKVKLVAAMKGLSDKVEVLTVDTNKGDPELNKNNPLSKIPCLVTDKGESIFDSHVVCEYLDSVGKGATLFPASGSDRWKALTLGALGDGILDAALLMVYEGRFRPADKIVPAWMERQEAKVNQSLDYLETHLPKWKDHPHYGHVTIACALGYLDFRHEGKWRKKHPKLVKWLDEFKAIVPAFEATQPQ